MEGLLRLQERFQALRRYRNVRKELDGFAQGMHSRNAKLEDLAVSLKENVSSPLWAEDTLAKARERRRRAVA